MSNCKPFIKAETSACWPKVWSIDGTEPELFKAYAEFNHCIL